LALNASSIMISTCVGSWDFAFDPCDSRTSSHFTCGVDCSAPISNISRVTGLRLEPNAGYAGPLSPAIGNLTALQQLAISENAFYGHIPATLGNCRHLFHLDLSMNSFTGRLPESLSLLSSLTFLSVAFNSLQGPIPNSFNHLKNLTYMYLDNNHFNGNIPSLTGMSALLNLDASNNAFTGALPALPTTISLLVLRTNHLTGHLPRSLKNLTLLQVLDLRENHLTGTIGSFLYTLPNLQTLNLSHNEFTAMEDLRTSPGEKSALLSVDLSFNRIVGTLPASLAAMTRLRVLALRSNMFTGGIPYSYALKAASSIAGSEQLGQLYLDDNYLSGEIPRPLLNLSADGFSADLVRNCLQSCPASLFFCKGGAQKSARECKVPVVLSG
jgi:Leucine-rich repeat (LRR) protein